MRICAGEIEKFRLMQTYEEDLEKQNDENQISQELLEQWDVKNGFLCFAEIDPLGHKPGVEETIGDTKH